MPGTVQNITLVLRLVVICVFRVVWQELFRRRHAKSIFHTVDDVRAILKTKNCSSIKNGIEIIHETKKKKRRVSGIVFALFIVFVIYFRHTFNAEPLSIYNTKT